MVVASSSGIHWHNEKVGSGSCDEVVVGSWLMIVFLEIAYLVREQITLSRNRRSRGLDRESRAEGLNRGPSRGVAQKLIGPSRGVGRSGRVRGLGSGRIDSLVRIYYYILL